MILLLCGCHVALPAVLGWLAAVGRRLVRNGLGGRPLIRWTARAQRSTQTIYDTGTILLAAAACAVAAIGATVSVRTSGLLDLILATAIGAAVPLLVYRLSGRSMRWCGLPEPGAALWLIGCAAGEEVLWRLLAPAALVALPGFSWGAAQLCAGAGFVLLHLPTVGRRGIAYQVMLTGVFVAVHHYGGLPAVIACHVLHNVVVAGVRIAPPPNPAPFPGIPESRSQW